VSAFERTLKQHLVSYRVGSGVCLSSVGARGRRQAAFHGSDCSLPCPARLEPVQLLHLHGRWTAARLQSVAPPEVKLPRYGWTSKNYVICVCFHCQFVMELLRITRQIHCKAVEQRATLIHRQYNRDWGTSYCRPTIDPYLTSPLLQNLGGATGYSLVVEPAQWRILGWGIGTIAVRGPEKHVNVSKNRSSDRKLSLIPFVSSAYYVEFE